MISGNYFVMKKVDKRREYFISYKRWTYQCILWCMIAGIVNLVLTKTKILMILVQFGSGAFSLLSSIILKL